MKKLSWFTFRFEVVNAMLIALVSLTTAFSVWRTNVVSSNAADESRLGMIDAVKEQAFENETYQKVYEEAGFAYEFAVMQAEVEALEAAESTDSRERGANIRQYLLPNMQLLAQPLATDERYLNSNGTYDLQKRLEDQRAANETPVDPAAAFKRADLFFSEQRWLVIGSILLVVSLFWLALAEVSSEKLRTVEFVIGLAIYLTGIVWFMGVEVIFFFLRRGA